MTGILLVLGWLLILYGVVVSVFFLSITPSPWLPDFALVFSAIPLIIGLLLLRRGMLARKQHKTETDH